MADRAEIWNTALSVLGEGLIIDPDNDQSREAILIRAVYGQARDFCLQQAYWHFARTRRRMTPAKVAPEFGWTSQYALPSDFVRIMPFKTEAGQPIPYAIESAQVDPGSDAYSRVLLIDDDGPLNVRYIRRVATEADFDATFANTLSGWLAMRIATPLTVDAGKVRDAERLFQTMLATGKRLNAQAAPIPPVNQDQMERVRRT